MERLVGPLRALTGHDVFVGAWTDVALVATLRPALVYVDLFEGAGAFVNAAVVGLPVEEPDTTGLGAVIDALRGAPVVYRGLRRPTGGAFGPGVVIPELERALSRLEALVVNERVLDVTGVWARAGLPTDERFGFGHGEAADPIAGAAAEAAALHALWFARVHGPVKCVVVDLDDTLVHGRITDADFAEKNPAYQPEGDGPRPGADAWWRLRRGLHEALRVLQQRGIVLALATRNDPAVVAARFRRRTQFGGSTAYVDDPMLATFVERIALDPRDFVHIEAGFGAKSEMCRSIAEALGVGLDALAFLDDAAFERAEVAANAPGVRVLHEQNARDVLLHGAGFVTWERTNRVASYTSRAAVVRAERTGALDAFLHALQIVVRVRRAETGELGRARELLQRAHQLDLNGARPALDGAEVWVATCRDRLADHGIVSVGVVRGGTLEAWVCSCRVLPHRVAATILGELLASGVSAEWRPTAYNGAIAGIVAEASAGAATWVRVERG